MVIASLSGISMFYIRYRYLYYIGIGAGQQGLLLPEIIEIIRCACHLARDWNVPGVAILQRRFVSCILHSNTSTPRNCSELGIPFSVVLLHAIKSIYPSQPRRRIHILQTEQSAIVQRVQCTVCTRIRDHRYTIMR